jgi:RNA polymerase sigma-70 factor (ECF subfamily)
MLKRIENEASAEDITIETFSKAFDKIASYNPEFQFNTWLISIAKNVHIDLLRKKKSSLLLRLRTRKTKRHIILPTPHHQKKMN